MDVRFEIAEHVRATTGAENTVLLDLRSGKYFALNTVGSLLWEVIAAGAPRGAALGRLAERFPEVPGERLERDAQTRDLPHHLLEAAAAALQNLEEFAGIVRSQ